MDGLLAKDWTFDEFMNRYLFTNPEDVLAEVLALDAQSDAGLKALMGGE